MLGGGVAAGIFGSLLGLGGGVLIVPLLTLGFNLPLRDAVGVSLVCVIVNSGASAGVFLERRTANLRLGMLLELFTASGAILAGLFAIILAYVAITMIRPRPTGGQGDAPAEPAVSAPAGPAWIDRLSGADYRIRRLWGGFAGSVVAGVASALLGIGGGLVKVPVMHMVMGVPLRVATATSNLMIGITASTSAWVYLLHGGIDPFATGPMAIGVFVGATGGSRIAPRVDLRALRLLFAAVLLYTSFEMFQRAVGS
jgi:uncharacterized membrane protein YfcA